MTGQLKLVGTIQALHERVIQYAKEAVVSAVECGHLLIKARQDIPEGQWLEFVDSTQVPRRTAYRYIKLAEAYQNNQLPDGLGLTALYRELGIIKTAEVGGPGSEIAKSGRSTLMQLDFCFTSLLTNLNTVKSVPVEELRKLDGPKLQNAYEEAKLVVARLEEAMQTEVTV